MNVLRSLLEAAVVLVVALGLARWALAFLGRKLLSTALPRPAAGPAHVAAAGGGHRPHGGRPQPPGPHRRRALAGLGRATGRAGPGRPRTGAVPALLHPERSHDAAFDPTGGRLQVALDEVLAYDPARQGWPGPAPVEWSRCRWPGVFWRRYEYLRLPLPQGDIILTSLVLSDMEPLVRYLRHFGVAVAERRRSWAWV
ncbi:MAG: hypothetical protein WKG07_07810 [Hymenobacter sp.]